MSRETLDDDRTRSVRDEVASARQPAHVHVATTTLGEATPAPGPRDEPRTADPQDDAVLELEVGPSVAAEAAPRRPRPGRSAVVACALTALVVGLLTAVVSTSAARRDPADTASPTLVGRFVPTTWSSAENGAAPFHGRVQLVNTGQRAVEIWRADLFGVPGDAFRTPVIIDAGSVGTVAASAEIPCGADVDESIVVEARVVDSAGSTNAMEEVLLEPMPTDMYDDPAGLVASACSVQSITGRLAEMRMEPDGSMTLRLVSPGDAPADLSVTAVRGSGVALDGGAASVAVALPEGGQADASLRVQVTDCALAISQLGQGGWLLEPRSEAAGGGWLDGWDPNVVSAAVGFAVARDCA